MKLRKNKRTSGIISQVSSEEKSEISGKSHDASSDKRDIARRTILDKSRGIEADGKTIFSSLPKPVPYVHAPNMKRSKPLWFWLTVAVSSLSAAVVIALPEQFSELAVVRQLLGSLLVLWFPGYAVTRAFRLNHALVNSNSEIVKAVALVCLSVCMSMAVAAILTMFQNYTFWGIQSYSVTLSLLAFTILFSTAAVVREHRAKE